MHGQDVNLLSKQLGAQVISTSDDFFAAKENLIQDEEPVFIPGKYTSQGKWMDGWESRRKRTPGNDWCIVKLAFEANLTWIDIDTSFFLGNHPPYASIDGLKSDTVPTNDSKWQPLLSQVPLKPGDHNYFALPEASQAVNYLRLNIFPDGGVARLRAYGEAQVKPKNGLVNLLAYEHGAKALACSDAFFAPMQNLILPSEPQNMGQGWETRRKRQPGHDWIILKPCQAGIGKEVQLSTAFYKGNYPDSFSLEVCTRKEVPLNQLIADASLWQALLDKQKLKADSLHTYKDLLKHEPMQYLRLNIFPDGGVARLRLLGSI